MMSQNHNNLTQRQQQKKNYLLQTLKKMQSVRKNLSKSFKKFNNIKNNNQKQSSYDNDNDNQYQNQKDTINYNKDKSISKHNKNNKSNKQTKPQKIDNHNKSTYKLTKNKSVKKIQSNNNTNKSNNNNNDNNNNKNNNNNNKKNNNNNDNDTAQQYTQQKQHIKYKIKKYEIKQQSQFIQEQSQIINVNVNNNNSKSHNKSNKSNNKNKSKSKNKSKNKIKNKTPNKFKNKNKNLQNYSNISNISDSYNNSYNKSKSNRKHIIDKQKQLNKSTNKQTNKSIKKSTNKSINKSKHKEHSGNKQKLQQLSSHNYHKINKCPQPNNSIRRVLFPQQSHPYTQLPYPSASSFHSLLISSISSPQKWLILFQSGLISIYFRIIKHKLIQLQIHSQQQLKYLSIQLDKKIYNCQNINEKFRNVKKKQIITLLASVRGINLTILKEMNCNSDKNQYNDGLFVFPQLQIEIKYNNNNNHLINNNNNNSTNIQEKQQPIQNTFSKNIPLPYSWVMLCQSINTTTNPSAQKILTRTSLQHIPFPSLSLNILKTFPFILISSTEQNKNNKIQKYQHKFNLEDNQYKLSIQISKKGKKKNYDIGIEGKGENIMRNMVEFVKWIM